MPVELQLGAMQTRDGLNLKGGDQQGECKYCIEHRHRASIAKVKSTRPKVRVCKHCGFIGVVSVAARSTTTAQPASRRPPSPSTIAAQGAQLRTKATAKHAGLR